MTAARLRFVLVLGLVVAACATPQNPDGTAARPDTTLFTGPVFLTGDVDVPQARAVEVDHAGRVVALHATTPEAHGRQITLLPGRLATPGLHDAHAHLMGIGRAADRVDLLGVKSIEEARQRVTAFVASRAEATHVPGRGWDQSRLPDGKFPTAKDLAGVADDIPIMLRRVDGHAVWLNDKALTLAGINKDTPDPEGGRILRDDGGNPTGILVDNAMEMLSKIVPPASDADIARWMRAGAEACADGGLVAVHDMGMSVRAYEALLALDNDGELPIRVFAYLSGDDFDATLNAAANAKKTDRVVVKGLKLFADGALGSRGARLLEPYSDEAGHKGLFLTSEADLQNQVAAIHARGLQAAIHAIGDAGNRAALVAIDKAQGADTARRHRVEHAQVVHPDDFARFTKTKAIASMQPTHATSDMRWAELRVGSERLAGAYAWRTFLDRSIPLAFGSDAPVESHLPAWGLFAAIARTNHAGEPRGGWRSDQSLAVAEAVRAFSAGAAFAVSREGDLGALRPGMAFDVTSFSRDPREDPGLWLQTESAATVVAGKLRTR